MLRNEKGPERSVSCLNRKPEACLYPSFIPSFLASRQEKKQKKIKASGTPANFAGCPIDRSLTIYRTAEALEGLAEDGVGGANVDAHVAFSAGAEHLTVVEGEVGTADEEVDEGIVIQLQAAAVEPNEEGGFGAQGADGGQVARAVVDQVVDVGFDVAEHGAAPRLAVAVGGDGGDGREEGRLVKLVGREPAVEAAAEGVVRHDGVGADDAGDVERLGGGAEGDAARRGRVGDGGEGRVAMAVEGHVGMDLVGDDKDAVAMADVG